MSKTIETSEIAINAVFTKFLRRYLGISNHCRKLNVHHITDMKPLFLTLKDKSLENLEAL